MSVRDSFGLPLSLLSSERSRSANSVLTDKTFSSLNRTSSTTSVHDDRKTAEVIKGFIPKDGGDVTTVPRSGSLGSLTVTDVTQMDIDDEVIVDIPNGDNDEDAFVDAAEELPSALKGTVTMSDTEGENQASLPVLQSLMGDGDVNQLNAFQTPERKRPFEVDSKTITRPKKPSVGVGLEEVFKPESTDSAPVSVPVVSSTPLAMSSAVSEAPPTVSPIKSVEQQAPRRPPTDQSSAPRPARQQTIVVSSSISRDVKSILAEYTAGMDESTAAALEKRLLSVVAQSEKEWSAKSVKIGQMMSAQSADFVQKQRQSDNDRAALMDAIKEMQAAADAEKSRGPTIRPTAPVHAAPVGMSADALAEAARIKKENHALQSENDKLHNQYNSLYDTYNQQRMVIPELKKKLDELEHSVQQEKQRYSNLKAHATDKLNQAGSEVDRLEGELVAAAKDHEDKTLGLRMRLKQSSLEVDNLRAELANKKREVGELKSICEELLRKTEVTSDSEM